MSLLDPSDIPNSTYHWFYSEPLVLIKVDMEFLSVEA